MKEVQLKQYAGPFETIPFDNFIQSPIGLVEKDQGNDVRLIFHLSYPRGIQDSVNTNTPKEECTIKYPDFSEAIKLCLIKGKGCKISRSDVKSAFRVLGIKREHWKYLVMKAVNPADGKTYYFFDKAVPFGSSISCCHFQRVSNSIAHIVSYRIKKPLVNYLDDFLTCHLIKLLCNRQLQEFIKLCGEIGMPINLEKTH